MKKKYTLTKKIVIIITIILMIIIVPTAISTIVNSILTVIERSEYKNIGEYTKVDGKKINVYSKITDDSKDTIILMNGYGTGSPVLDFMPLTNELSKNYNVAVVENFGYGWSDKTDKERTSANIVEETRAALKQSGINPPYILMPHSMSGIYSLYYANKYPDEIKAIIGLDTSVPAQRYYLDFSNKRSNMESLITTIGIVRIVTKINPSMVTPNALEGVYSKESLKVIRAMYCWNNANKSLISEYNNTLKNMQDADNYKYPSDMPVLFFLSKQAIETNTEIGKNWVRIHEELISNVEDKQITILEGSHFLHWTDYKEIAQMTYQFLNNK